MTSSNCVCDRKAVTLFFSDSSTSFDLEEQIEMVPFQEVEGAHDELRSPGHNYRHPTYLHPGQFCSLAGKAIFS